MEIFLSLDKQGVSFFLFFLIFFSFSVSQSWSIRITQYACDYQNLAPSGCTEYLFGSSTGQISSYNFNNGNGYNLANQNQKICIRSEGTNCR